MVIYGDIVINFQIILSTKIDQKRKPHWLSFWTKNQIWLVLRRGGGLEVGMLVAMDIGQKKCQHACQFIVVSRQFIALYRR